MHAPRPLAVLLALGNGIVGGMETAVQRLVRSRPQHACAVTALVPYEGDFAAALRDAGAAVAIAPMPPDPQWHAVQLRRSTSFAA